MSDKDLIADARAAMDYSDDTGWFWVGRLADALAAASKVHEPKDLSIMNGWLVEMVGKHNCGTGPDGHYGAHEPGCGYEPHLNLAELEGWPGAERDAANEDRQQAEAEIRDLLKVDIPSLKAERDAALAAVERVRAVHRKFTYYELEDSCPDTSEGHREERHHESDEIGEFYCEDMPTGDVVCDLCRDTDGERMGWPCPTVAALDGAPEPDREAQLERVAARLREIVYLCGDDLGCQCEEAQDASADLAMELSIIAAERPTLTADEVWAIAKAEHDWANDSDNVGAFVDSLTDALRTAGVAFDEQPFIDSGYLLPVEGESRE